ncbi:P-loop containing nucleoside triphosphate hydrolase protein [Apiosordaria backusii]|uniref:P-loop containing nucleoside triphosphate hydrolase protein n=1 Tax=Apiosordaria backusii TaxID=314023 RepID=A0AA40EMC3_9PEZI|nr:P-loop containing nucleoside triphosphate hydrolase protein [Apiosordaria backusii]
MLDCRAGNVLVEENTHRVVIHDFAQCHFREDLEVGYAEEDTVAVEHVEHVTDEKAPGENMQETGDTVLPVSHEECVASHENPLAIGMPLTVKILNKTGIDLRYKIRYSVSMAQSSESIDPSAVVNRYRVFDKWTKAASSTRKDIFLHTQQIIKEIHPDHHVTRAKPSDIDLLGYAAAGHANAVQDNYNPPGTTHNVPGFYLDACRVYKASPKPFDQPGGTLNDKIYFGRWLYTWQNLTFILYKCVVQDPECGEDPMLYILAPNDTAKVDELGHHFDTDKLLLAAGDWSCALHDEIYVYDNGNWIKDPLLWQSVQGASWDDVILEPTMKEALMRDVIGFFDTRDVYQDLGLMWKRGIILHGLPGNGKTASIKALINSLEARGQEDGSKKIPSLYVKAFDSCHGGKWSIRYIFQHARKMAPCVLIFEDLDSLVLDEYRSYFLNEVDGLESNEGILMIGSTNHLSKLDPAIAKRPSRFDRKYRFKLPDEETRERYADYWRKKLEGKPIVSDKFDDDISPLVAKVTEGFSFAYLRELFMSSLLALVRGFNPDEAEEDPQENDADDGSSSTTGDGILVDKPTTTEEDNNESTKDKTEEEKEEEKEKTDEKEEKKEAKPKRVFPVVEVPEHLKDNLLLKIILSQAKILFDEMDRDDDERKESGGAGFASGVKRHDIPSLKRRRVRRVMAARPPA